ncbi:MAG: NAD-dependent DNA ligase LigA [Deltaproteobacteria bacterium]|nr:NAD-dependent DNA ligase LigA [Deltaproteobacteria bacterium]
MKSISEPWLLRLSVSELEAQVRHHNAQYWDKHAPEISDYDYDRLVVRLRALAPDSRVLDELGENPVKDPVVGEAPPVRHRAKMLSLDKCYSHEELRSWGTSFVGDVVVTPKFDGIACSIHYDEHGALTLAVTRGDGEMGENITANVRGISDVPQAVSVHSVEVRGEVYMKLSVFERFKAEGFANPRNLAAGAIKQKDPAKSRAYGLSFAAYDLLGTDHATERAKMDALTAMGFVSVERRVFSQDKMVDGYEDLAARRSALDFEIDGVVFKADRVDEQRRLGATSHHPRYAMAYKFQGDSGSTIVREIQWSVARSGAITPVALIDPVTLSGATVSRASLHNAGYISKLTLSKNATVVVMRRGGVIPNVEFVSKAGDVPFDLPEACPSCDGAIRRDGDFLHCAAPRACRSAVIGQLAHFASVVGMLGFGDSLLAGAFDRGILREPADFYGLTERKLLLLDRTGSRLAKRLLREVDRSRKLDLATFLRAFGMHEVGKTVSVLLAEKFGSLERLYGVDEVMLASIHGVGPSIASAVVQGLREYRESLDKTFALIEIVALTDRPAASAAELTRSGALAVLAGQSFVFTGTLATLRRAEAERLVKDRGGMCPPSVTKSLTFLVVGDVRDGDKSSKHKAAEKLIESGGSIRVITEREFLSLIKEVDGARPKEPTTSEPDGVTAKVTSIAATVSSTAIPPTPAREASVPETPKRVLREDAPSMRDDPLLAAFRLAVRDRGVDPSKPAESAHLAIEERKTVAAEKSSVLKGAVVLFAGRPALHTQEDWKQKLEARGAVLSDALSATTTHVVAPDRGRPTEVLIEARVRQSRGDVLQVIEERALVLMLTESVE